MADRKIETMTAAEDTAVDMLVAKGWNRVTARQKILEDRYRTRRLPVPARGV